MRKKAPYILLLFLVFLLIFLLGVRYGRKVERYDKYFYFILSLTPSPKKEKQRPPSYSFKFLNFKECKISFVYPEDFKVEKNERTLKLYQDKNLRTRIDCFEEKPEEKPEGKKVELKFKDKKIQGFEKNGFIFFEYRSEKNNLFYRIKILPELFPLFSGSAQFSK